MPLKSFNAYHSYLKSIEPLNDAERGRLFTSLLIYSSTGAEPELHGNERFIFPTMKEQIDRDRKKYEQMCQRQRQNVSKRWDTTVYGGKSGIPNDTTVYQTYHNKDKDKDKDKEKEDGGCKGVQRGRFTPPTREVVAEYCAQRRNGIDAAMFVDYYSARGWKYKGGTAMKDWKAAVRTWERTKAVSSPERDGPEEVKKTFGWGTKGYG
jgi:hypothetical protein